jgi:hypothetical protein
MINFSNIYEGVLGDVDTSISGMDDDMAAVKKEIMFSLFPALDGSSVANSTKHGVLITHKGTFWGGLVLEKFINSCCSFDDNVLTIDLSKNTNGGELTVCINPKPLIDRNIMVKVLDHPDRKIYNDVYELAQARVYTSITIANNYKNAGYIINLKKLIHPDTNVVSVQFGDFEWRSYKDTVLMNSDFPGTIKEIAYYNCVIKKISKLPKIIQLSRPLMADTIAGKLNIKLSDVAFNHVRTSITLKQ